MGPFLRVGSIWGQLPAPAKGQMTGDISGYFFLPPATSIFVA